MKGTARMLLSLLAASGLFLMLFLVLHWNPIVSFLLSAGVYFGLFLLLKPSRKIAGLRLDGLTDGEVSLSGTQCRIHLTNGGEIRLEGTVKVNGEPLEAMIQRVAGAMLGGGG